MARAPLTDVQQAYLARFTSLEQDVEDIVRAAFRLHNSLGCSLYDLKEARGELIRTVDRVS